jgi:hypothetical protein
MPKMHIVCSVPIRRKGTNTGWKGVEGSVLSLIVATAAETCSITRPRRRALAHGCWIARYNNQNVKKNENNRMSGRLSAGVKAARKKGEWGRIVDFLSFDVWCPNRFGD